ncbi:MAG: glycoside hydrolase family 57 protein [Bacteroidales bacterium]|nr:glycoside hydrolase family 57 protein [Bacteroidales bacterium]
MKSICLYFQVHQPMRLRRYRFFDIGNEHYYYDDHLNESTLRNVADNCYLPTNKILLDLIKEYGVQFKVAFSITGLALDQFRLYAPDVLDSFKELAQTGCVEFLTETYSHSLITLKDDQEFQKQVNAHRNLMKELFDYEPVTFRNTELIYNDGIGEMVANMGFKGMLTEGASHVLGWKSPNYVYCNAANPKLKTLLRNYELSDDIGFRFSNTDWQEYPLTTEKYVDWILEGDKTEEVVNIFLDYETFGEHNNEESGILEFLKAFPKEVFKSKKLNFKHPREVIESHQPVSAIHAPHPISWADEEKDLTAWLGNNMQEDAFNRLYALMDKINKCDDPKILTDWKYLQASDHFYYMCTKVFSDGAIHAYYNPFTSPYDAYINFMNVLADFIIRVNASVPENEKDKEIATLASIIFEKNILLEKHEQELAKLKSKLKTLNKTSKEKASTSKSGGKSKEKTSVKTTQKTNTKSQSRSRGVEAGKTTNKTEKIVVN